MSRSVPLLVGDYCFVRNSGDDNLVCILVLKLYPYGMLFAAVVNRKGFDEDIVKKGELLYRGHGTHTLLLSLWHRT